MRSLAVLVMSVDADVAGPCIKPRDGLLDL